MARKNDDGIIIAAHYMDEGDVDWVQAFLRRGPIWSDIVIMSREALVEEIKSGKNYVAGTRVEYMGTTFETADVVNLITNNDHDVLVTGDIESKTDRLDNIPIL
jgi:hypothetical protein